MKAFFATGAAVAVSADSIGNAAEVLELIKPNTNRRSNIFCLLPFFT